MPPNHSVSWYWLSTAEISPCGLYRPSLTRSRRFPIGCAVLSVTMLNPSTADATKNDPTIKRLLGFCDRLGFDELIVTNLWSLRATDPSDLAKAPDMGAFDEPILKAASQAKVVVVAWGGVRRENTGRSGEGCPCCRDAPGVRPPALWSSHEGWPPAPPPVPAHARGTRTAEHRDGRLRCLSIPRSRSRSKPCST